MKPLLCGCGGDLSEAPLDRRGSWIFCGTASEFRPCPRCGSHKAWRIDRQLEHVIGFVVGDEPELHPDLDSAMEAHSDEDAEVATAKPGTVIRAVFEAPTPRMIVARVAHPSRLWLISAGVSLGERPIEHALEKVA